MANLVPLQTGIKCRDCGADNLGWYCTSALKWRLVGRDDVGLWAIHYCKPADPVVASPPKSRPLRDPARIMHPTNLHATFRCPYCEGKMYVEQDAPHLGARSWHTFVDMLPDGLTVPHAKACRDWADHRRRERAQGELLNPRPREEAAPSQYGTARL